MKYTTALLIACWIKTDLRLSTATPICTTRVQIWTCTSRTPPLRCVLASQKSNEVSPLREPQQAPAQKLDRSRFFRSTILPRKSHIRQEQPYALGAAAKWVLVTRCSCVSRVGCRMASGIVSDLSWYQKLHNM